VCLQISSVYATTADWLVVTGKAPLSAGSYEAVKTQAISDAFQQAAVLGEKRSGRAFPGKSQIQREYKEGGYLLIDMQVELTLRPVCEDSQANAYKKQLAVAGFSLQAPADSAMGYLSDVERGFAGMLSQRLETRDNLLVFEQSQLALHTDSRNAPSHYSEQLTLTQATQFAKQAGVQFVVSGIVRNMGIEDSRALATDYWTRMKRMVGNTHVQRHFTVDIFIHDGFSGALVWQQQFSATGKWEADLTTRMAFDSPAFLQQAYGRNIDQLVSTVAEEIAEHLRCQPFMTRISRVEGKTLHFTAGAGSGIRPGDRLGVYRTSRFFDADRLAGVDLQNVKTALTVSQVHPHFSSGTIAVDPGRLNIQEDDLLIVW
jgi:hypothetical protein